MLRIFRNSENVLCPMTRRLDDVAVVSAFHCVRIVPHAEVMEIVQSENKRPGQPKGELTIRG